MLFYLLPFLPCGFRRAMAPVVWIAILLALGVAVSAPVEAAVTRIEIVPNVVTLTHGQTKQFSAVVTVTAGSSTDRRLAD